MGKRHAAALSTISRAKADEEVREAQTRRQAAERERQLLTSYLGTREQVQGTGEFAGSSPDALKYTQRYSFDPVAVREIQGAQASVGDPFTSGDPVRFAQGIADEANDLLAKAEAAARAGDTATAEQLFGQAQSVISARLGGYGGVLGSSFNLEDTPESQAKFRASNPEAQIVGRQLLTARELGDPSSQTSQELRGRLLDPSLAVIDENVRNAERAIASERSEIEGRIRQTAGTGGVGFNARAQLAAQSQAASDAALTRAEVFTTAGAQKSAATAQINLYLNEFAKRMAEDSVGLAQEWVNGTAGVRDVFQESLNSLSLFSAEMSSQWARLFFAKAEREDAQGDAFKLETRGKLRDLAVGFGGALLSAGLSGLGAGGAAALGGAGLSGSLSAAGGGFFGTLSPGGGG